MTIKLTAIEARIVGCLIEKAITTPDQYPLSLNALINACNQKSNREPLMELDEREVQQSLDALVRKHLVLDRSGFGSRVPKYQQRFCNTGFGTLAFTPLQTAILCELLLRNAQTPGELRTRAARMTEVKEASEVEAALHELAARADGPFVVQLSREPGRRDARYAHLLSGEVAVDESPDVGQTESPRAASLANRVEALEQLVADLQLELQALQRKLTNS